MIGLGIEKIAEEFEKPRIQGEVRRLCDMSISLEQEIGGIVTYNNGLNFVEIPDKRRIFRREINCLVRELLLKELKADMGRFYEIPNPFINIRECFERNREYVEDYILRGEGRKEIIEKLLADLPEIERSWTWKSRRAASLNEIEEGKRKILNITEILIRVSEESDRSYFLDSNSYGKNEQILKDAFAFFHVHPGDYFFSSSGPSETDERVVIERVFPEILLEKREVGQSEGVYYAFFLYPMPFWESAAYTDDEGNVRPYCKSLLIYDSVRGVSKIGFTHLDSMNQESFDSYKKEVERSVIENVKRC